MRVIPSPRFATQPAFPILLISTVIILNGDNVGVGLSECASVRLPVTEEISMENTDSLANSKILTDHRTPFLSPPSSTFKVNPLGTKSNEQETTSVFQFKSSKTTTGSEREGADVAEYTSRLDVARCRATCLETFIQDAEKDEEASIHPNIRVQRRTRSPGSSTFLQSASSCFHNSPECLSCWKSCQLLATTTSTNNPEALSPVGLPTPASSISDDSVQHGKKNTGGKLIDEDMKSKHKHPILACSRNTGENSNEKQRCTGGCEIACTFYARLATNNGDDKMTHYKSASKRVVKITSSKMTWPTFPTGLKMTSEESRHVIYVAIQKCLGNGWKEISQTTTPHLHLPPEIIAQIKTKLCTVRVLVVGPEGLRSVYDLENSAAGSGRKFPAKKALDREEKVGAGGVATDDETADTAELAAVGLNVDSSNSDTNYSNVKNSSSPTHKPNITTTHNPFTLKLEKLIHQRSLVIAKLTWNPTEGTQEYLITWELTGGGLKGHLVTDSTSVTLSLWPDTTYQVQVEEFDLSSLDSVGGELAVTKNLAQKSTLIVNTSVASFPMGRASALVGSGEVKQDEEFDEYSDEESEEVGNDEVTPSDKSVGRVLGVFLASLTLVVITLTLVAFVWVKLRVSFGPGDCEKVERDVSESSLSSCFGGCTFCGEGEDTELLVLEEEEVEEKRSNFHEDSTQFVASPLHYTLELKRMQDADKSNVGFGILSALRYSFSSSRQTDVSADDPGVEQPHRRVSIVQPPVATISRSLALPDDGVMDEGRIRIDGFVTFDPYYARGLNDDATKTNCVSLSSREPVLGNVANTFLC